MELYVYIHKDVGSPLSCSQYTYSENKLQEIEIDIGLQLKKVKT